MQNKKKILYISPFARPNIGGAESSLDKLMGFASRKGYFPVLITYQPLTTNVLGAKHEVGIDYEIFRVPWFGRGWFNKLEKYFPLVFLYLFPGLLIKSLVYYMKHSDEICCIHVHGMVAGLIGTIITLFKKKRLIISTHAVYNLKNRKFLALLFRIIFARYNIILAVSEVSREELISIGVPESKVRIHKNWVDTEKWHPVKKMWGEQLVFDKNINLLFVGRLLEKKGIKLFIEASKKLPEVGFHIVGNGPLESYVEEASLSSGNLKYYGVLNHDNAGQFLKIIYLYSNCNFLISPYLYEEGFATVLVESLACGTPVIVTNRGSPPTFLNNKVAKFLSSNPNVNELVSVIEGLYEKEHCEFDRRVCRNFAVENFGVQNAQEVINTYEQDR